MKAIMISIKPEWVAKILNGEKTIEIRKTMPKCDLPIDVYIYCTGEYGKALYYDNEYKVGNVRCIPFNTVVFCPSGAKDALNGKVVAKFTLNKVEQIWWRRDNTGMSSPTTDTLGIISFHKASCLITTETSKYLNHKIGYAWHIDNLEIFDKPKELSEFETTKQQLVYITEQTQPILQNIKLTKSPQSWCYVEVE